MNLCEAERVSYLANVLAIAGASGQVTADEMAVLKQAARHVGATPEDIHAARTLLDSGHFEPALMRDHAIRMANLEDMLAVALADGRLDESESEPIEQLASAMNFTQADVDLAVRRVQLRLQQDGRRPGLTVQGSAPRDRDASSGASSTPHGASRPILDMSSRNESESGTPNPGQGWVAPDAPAVRDGASPDPDVMGNEVDECMLARGKAVNPIAYCFGMGTPALNAWGCRLLKMPWGVNREWMRLGSFRSDQAFIFDRDAILESLEKALPSVSACPYVKPAYARYACSTFPSRARAGLRWCYRPAVNDGEGAVVTEQVTCHGCAINVRRRVIGLDPVGSAEWRRVVRDACRGCSLPLPWN